VSKHPIRVRGFADIIELALHYQFDMNSGFDETPHRPVGQPKAEPLLTREALFPGTYY